MVRWLLAALLVIPLADAFFLIVVAGFIGAVPTIALVVLTALLGMLLVRAEGRHTLRKMQRSAMRGEAPTNEMIDGGMLVAAGAFLLTPGLVTDAVGFLFALPLTRVPIRVLLKRYVIVPALDEETDGFVTGNVYTVGFPGDDGPDRAPGWVSHPGGPDSDGGDTVDLGEDAYEVEFEDDDRDD